MSPILLTPNGSRLKALALAIALASPAAAKAAEIVVKISGVSEPLGQIACALFAASEGFPLNDAGARVLWQPANANGVTCRFAEVSEGTYALSVGHDLNGNRKVDTNIVGLPTEQWGVSNNARPGLRAPRFDEASFKVAGDGKEIVVEIKLGK